MKEIILEEEIDKLKSLKDRLEKKDPISAEILDALQYKGQAILMQSVRQLARKVAKKLKVSRKPVRSRVNRLERAGVLITYKWGKYRKVHIHWDLISKTDERILKTFVRHYKTGMKVGKTRRIEETIELAAPYKTCKVKCTNCEHINVAKWNLSRKLCWNCGKTFWIQQKNILDGNHFRKSERNVSIVCANCGEEKRTVTTNKQIRCRKCKKFIEVKPTNFIEQF